jgi:hypothetical protein
MPELEKIIPHPKDLKVLCVKHLVLDDAKDLMKWLGDFEKDINSFSITNDIKHTEESADAFLDSWAHWKREQGKKHPKFVASCEKDIVSKVNESKKELEERKKDDVPATAKALRDSCKEIMIDTATIGSTVTVGRLLPLADSIRRRSANVIKSMQFIKKSSGGNQKVDALIEGVTNELRGLLVATKGLDTAAKALDANATIEKESQDKTMQELVKNKDWAYKAGRSVAIAGQLVQRHFS